MSEQRNGSRLITSFLSRRHRLVSGGVAALLVSGLALGGLASPASAAALPNNVTLEQWADVGGNWITGALGLEGQGDSAYEEGETVPFRLDVSSAGAGTFDFSVCRDYSNGAIRGYLSLEPYSTSRTPLITGTVTSAATGSAQPFTGGAVAGGVSIDSVTEVGGTCGANQRETQVQITIAPGSSGAYVLWGGRLASPADAGVGPAHGASQFPGGSLSMRLGGSAKNLGIKVAPTTTTTVAPTTTTTVAPTTTTTVAPTTTTTAPLVGPKVEEGDPCNRVALSRGNNNPCPVVVVRPEVKDEPATTTTAAPVVDPGTTVAGGGEKVFPAPEQVLGGQVERAMPAPVDNPLQSGGTLPRTGQGIGSELTLAFGLVGSGLALLRLARRRRPATQQ